MPAFTHLCQKFNISLAHNTITLYPKKIPKNLLPKIGRCFKYIAKGMDFEFNLAVLPIDSFDALGRPTFVKRNDVDHFLYHDDSFDMDDTHYHMKFALSLDEKRLDYIFSIFVKYDLFTAIEKNTFMDAYRRANKIDAKEFTQHVSKKNKFFVPEIDHRKLASPEESKTRAKDKAEPKVDKFTQGSERRTEGKKQQCLPNYTQAEKQFLIALHRMKAKERELRKKAARDPINFSAAAHQAKHLCTQLGMESEKYFANKDKISYKIFQANCIKHIAQARPELEKHRGYKDILANMGLAIAGLGVFYLMAIGINYHKSEGKHLFFHFDTDSVKKINEIEKTIEAAAPAA